MHVDAIIAASVLRMATQSLMMVAMHWTPLVAVPPPPMVGIKYRPPHHPNPNPNPNELDASTKRE